MSRPTKSSALAAAAVAVPDVAPEVLSCLDLLATQIEGSMRESEAPVGVIAAAVGELAAETAALERELPGVGPLLREAVIALQFYDRLSQRLAHVRDALRLLAANGTTPRELATLLAAHAPAADPDRVELF